MKKKWLSVAAASMLAVSSLLIAASEASEKVSSIAAVDPASAGGQPVTDIPPPDEIDEYWSYQWNMQRLMANMETMSCSARAKETHTAL